VDRRPVGVFDSGMGGLTVLHECLVTMPHEDFVYLGDGARLPYGPRPLDEIRRFSLEIAGYLEAQGVKLILVACNAATSAALPDLQERWGRLDGLLHAIGFAPESCLRGGFQDAPWEDVSKALHISTYSYVALGRGFADLLAAGEDPAIVGLDFDAQVAWPGYDWMGVAKAGLESASRYLARELGPEGVRVNLVAAGPLQTMAAKSIDGFDGFEPIWEERAPLGWDSADPTPVAKAVCALLSDWMPGITGEIVHVDGGYHAIGAGTR
jgi:meromycolic acid enoyl-[acyl-carrier-protein] reductase